MTNRTDQQDPQPTPQPCTGCSGNGGTVIDNSGPATDGSGRHIHRQTWQQCQGCSGTGQAAGH